MKVESVHNMGAGFVCNGCGREFQYGPILMPASRPEPIEDKPGLMDCGNVRFCIDCVKKQLPALKEKILRGEMFPTRVWSTGRNPKIVEAVYRTDSGLRRAGDMLRNSKEGEK